MSFFTDYVETALWSSTDESDESGSEPLDASYGIEDIAPASLAEMQADCDSFEEENAADLAEYQERTGYLGGHDFWLTRRHR
jgi:hypothetical protein